MDWQQKIRDEYRQAAEKAEAAKDGSLNAISWNDLHIETTILPELKRLGQEAIRHFLGYLPLGSVTIPYEPFLRALIQGQRQKQLNKTEYLHQLKEHIKLIRNKDMELTYNTCIADDKTIYKNYAATFVPYGHTVKSRILTFLGYEPKLEHSVVAEMWIRHMIGSDTLHLPDEVTDIDQKAITMIKYREILFEEGRAAADASSLFVFVKNRLIPLSY